MATTRLLRSSTPIQLPNSSSSSSICTTSFVKCVRYQSRASLNNNNGDHHTHNISSGKGDIRKPVVAVKAASVANAATDRLTTSQPAAVIPQVLSNLAALIASSRNAMLVLFRDAVRKRRQWNNLNLQMLIERGIVDCRFFTLLAVAGSLLGSVLCFVEGCVLVMESYAHYFHTVSQRLEDQGHLVHLLIEAIDMFLVGTALIVFGVGLYAMFVGSRTPRKEKESTVKSRRVGWVGMESIGEAKSKIGHAVMMIVQVGILEKFKDIPFVTGFDLACFAAAVLTSSASIFVLSRLHTY